MEHYCKMEERLKEMEKMVVELQKELQKEKKIDEESLDGK